MKDRNSKLRDKFAIAALQGTLADPKVRCGKPEGWAEFCKNLSEECYELADAMLVARNKGMTAEVAAPEHPLPYEGWQQGDVLRVIATEPGDPFKVGDLVIHADTPGNHITYVCLGSTRYPMANEELEFVSRSTLPAPPYHQWQNGDLLQVTEAVDYTPEGIHVGQYVVYCDATVGREVPYVAVGIEKAIPANHLKFIARP